MGREFGTPVDRSMGTAVESVMESAIYTGRVRHRRLAPKAHQLSYRVFMFWLDLDEIPEVFSMTKLWSSTRSAFVQFRRSDFFDGTEKPLKNVVLDWVKEQTGDRPEGPVRMLANLRIAGYLINPIVCYYLYSKDGARLEYVVAEVTNTPWGRRQHYLLPCKPLVDASSAEKKLKEDLCGEFTKAMHVSPFHPMDMIYRWRLQEPGSHLNLHFDCLTSGSGEKVFDATLMLQREALTPKSMRNILWRYPLMTMNVALAIYWQAVKLRFKGVPFYPNPHSRSHKNTASL